MSKCNVPLLDSWQAQLLRQLASDSFEVHSVVMGPLHSIDNYFSDRRTLIALITTYLAMLIALAAAIWFELPHAVATGLLVTLLVIAPIAAVCAGRLVARSRASVSFRERSSTSARTVGVLVFVACVSLAIACAKLIYPRSWPTSVEEALAILNEELDTDIKTELAYMGYDDLLELNQGWATSIRDRFGLSSRNDRLLSDCDPEYKHPDSCTSLIISRFWKRVRTALPASERQALEALERKMERVRVKSQQFEQQPLKDVVAFFDDAIRKQLSEDAQFTIRYEPSYAEQSISTSWHAMESVSLREALGIVAASTQFKVRKSPPDVLIVPD